MPDSYTVADLKTALRANGWIHDPEKDTGVNLEYWHNGLGVPGERSYGFELIRKTVYVLAADYERIVAKAKRLPGKKALPFK